MEIGIRAFAGAGWRALTQAEDQVERDGVGTFTEARKRSYSNTRQMIEWRDGIKIFDTAAAYRPLTTDTGTGEDTRICTGAGWSILTQDRRPSRGRVLEPLPGQDGVN